VADSEDRQGVDHAEEGRDAARRLMWGEAFEAFVKADDVSEMGTEDLESWSTAAYLLGRVDIAVSARSRAHRAHLERGDLESAVRGAVWIALMLTNKGDMAQASGWMSQATRLAEALAPESVGHGYVFVLEAYRLTAIEHLHDEGIEAAAASVRVGRTSGEPDLVALGLNVGGRATIRARRIEQGLQLLDEAMVTVLSAPLSPPVAGTVYCSLIEACEEIGDLRRAREWTDALSNWCELQQGMVTFTGQCLTHRAHVLRRHGDLAGASAAAEEARSRFQGAVDERLTGVALYELGEVSRLRGDLRAAEESFFQAGEWGRDPQPGLTLLRLAQGRIEEAAASARRLEAEWTTPRSRIRLLPAYVEVMIAVGDAEAARTAAAELQDLARDMGTELLVAEAHSATGAVELATGPAETALLSLRAALGKWIDLEAPYEAARTRILISDACRRLGDEDTAKLELAAAKDGLRRLGLSIEFGEAAADQHHGLSPRELQVLGLVATGSTNQEIADELSLSVKTIDRHVSNILTKLGVPSRTAATAFAYQQGLV
jgi:ATP/maltotriose-dependent transcriptional regulator MalT